MSTYFLFGKTSPASLQGMSAERTDKAEALIKKFGGNVKSMYALLGEQDFVLITDFPGTESAMKASIGLAKLTQASFTTWPAVAVEDFDKMLSEI